MSSAAGLLHPPQAPGLGVVLMDRLVTGPKAAPCTRQAVGPASHTAPVQPCPRGPAPCAPADRPELSTGVGQRLPGSRWEGSSRGTEMPVLLLMVWGPSRLVKGWLSAGLAGGPARCRQQRKGISTPRVLGERIVFCSQNTPSRCGRHAPRMQNTLIVHARTLEKVFNKTC